MIEGFLLLLLFLTPSVYPSNVTQQRNNETCQVRFLSKSTTPSRLSFNVSEATYEIYHKIVNQRSFNFSNISREIFLQRGDVVGLIITSTRDRSLGLNIMGRLKVFPNATAKTDAFWKSFTSSKTGWTPPFKDCDFFRDSWFYSYVLRTSDISIGLFIQVELNQCDNNLEEIFHETHRCEVETTYCEPIPGYDGKRGGYRCVCRPGYFYPRAANLSSRGSTGEDIESGHHHIDSPRCVPCPENCANCGQNGFCLANMDVYLKTIIFSVHLGCMVFTFILGFIVFKQRKTKAISTGMWTILETILLGICILYSTMLVKLFEPSIVRCLLEPWTREVGFIICYGAIILKLYRHLIEFRTRKAHRWVVKDTDLLKYLLIMTSSVFAYMAAFTAIMLNFMQENYSFIYEGLTVNGQHYQACKPLWWDFVTEAGELIILIFGIHLSYASRNARTQFHERSFLCAAISIELAFSALFYAARILVLPGLHPDHVLIICSVRTQLSTTTTLLLVFVPKFWYQHKQVRSMGQEYSCRLPVDAFKDMNAHGPLTGNNSDVDVGEVTLADMNPDDIRAELKRLYLQLEIFKNKTICRDNPHISKRRGGRKAAHRRFSLQGAISQQSSSSTKTKRWSSVKTIKQRSSESQVFSLTVSGHETLCSQSSNLHSKRAQRREEETTEAEASRTPEDSVCSIEGPSTVYNDLLTSTTHSSDH